jgi:hypothetical protein
MVHELHDGVVTSRLLAGLVLSIGIAACRGPDRSVTPEAELRALVDSLMPVVEEASGLTFKRTPRAVIVSREEARAFIRGQLAEQLPSDRARHLTISYQLLGLLPDSIDLGQLFLAVLGEQVAGYYDPDSGAFYGVSGGDPATFRLTVIHELVHALQHDYVALDSILDARDNADRLVAAQAVLEGQATLAMFRAQPGIEDQVLTQEFWDAARESIREQQSSLPQFSAAPRVIRETLLFPYVGGAEFMRWWINARGEAIQPFDTLMPLSSEQILAPARSLPRDRPLTVTFSDPTGPAVLYEDVLGAMELRILLAEARGQEELVDAAVLGWGGDRFRLYDDPAGDALVWIAVFDAAPARDLALAAFQGGWPRARAGYRNDARPLEVSGRPGLRLVVAPAAWGRWNVLPTASAAP